MTIQEVFDTIVRNMIRQGRPGYDHERMECLYHHEGLCCAIGSLINPKERSVFLEGRSPGSLMRNGVIPKIEDEQFYEDMQTAHDESALTGPWLESFLREARAVAKDWGLDATVCEVRI